MLPVFSKIANVPKKKILTPKKEYIIFWTSNKIHLCEIVTGKKIQMHDT